MKKIVNIAGSCLLALLLPGGAENAWALQSHGAPEGLYVHQIAHVLFLAALLYLFLHTRRTQENNSRGWTSLQIFCVIFILWNILAFSGHEVFKHLNEGDLVDKNSWNEHLAPPITLLKALYYITKMDHFLFTPGLLALMVSLRSFYRQALREETK